MIKKASQNLLALKGLLYLLITFRNFLGNFFMGTVSHAYMPYIDAY